MVLPAWERRSGMTTLFFTKVEDVIMEIRGIDSEMRDVGGGMGLWASFKAPTKPAFGNSHAPPSITL